MSVPEAAMHENDFSTRGKDDVRFARQIGPMQAVAIAHSMQQPTYDHLGLRIAALDRAHDFAA